MRILVTGHHGYVGSVTVPALQAAGHAVVGLDTMYYEGCDLSAEPEPLDVDVIRADVRDVDTKLLQGFDAIVHLAALSNDPLGALDPALTLRINFEATLELARAAKSAGVHRFVLASSCSMYGAWSGSEAVDEGAPLQPLTAYAESKVRSESALRELVGDGFTAIFMRNATVFGVSPRLRVDLVLNNLVGWAFTTGRVRILSDGTPWRPIVHVRDVANATAALLEAPEEAVAGEAFNVGSDSENYQVSELAEIVRDTVPGCEIEYAGSGEPDPRSYRVDFEKFARAFPDFRFGWSARRGAEELYEAYRAIGLTLDEFESARFIRLRRLNGLVGSGRLDGELRWQG